MNERKRQQERQEELERDRERLARAQQNMDDEKLNKN